MFSKPVQIALPKATAVALDDSSSYDQEIWKWEWLTKPICFLMVDVVCPLFVNIASPLITYD